MTITSKAVAFGAVASSIVFMFNQSPLNSYFGVGASYPDDDDPTFVTCQSAIKLTHKESGGTYFLNSSNQNYGSGSRQQVVSLTPNEADHTSHWVVREANKESLCEVGQPVACNSHIRLTHNESGLNLHSHQFRSGLSGQQEISCYGSGDGEGDGGDDWRVICERPTDEYWLKGRPVRFQHVETEKYLGGTLKAKFTESNCGNCPILHHLEAFGRGRKDDYSIFTADSGIFMST